MSMDATKYKPYPAYKESGVEWLGEVPGHWEVKPIKRIASSNDDVLTEKTPDEYEIEYVDISSVDEVGGIIKTEEMIFKNAPSRARRLVKNGDVIVSTVRTYLKAIAPIKSPNENLVFSTGFAVIRPNKELLPAFAAYLFKAHYLIELIISRSVGVSYPAINSSDLVSLKTALPSLEEQHTIAFFLNRETEKIDTLIAKQERLIELLAEKRTALISHAVTKGLNPDAPMKDSGVEWLGEVPGHWKVLSLARITSLKCDGPFGSGLKTEHYTDEGARVIRLQNIRKGSFDDSDSAYIDLKYFQQDLSLHEVRRGDLLIAGLGDSNNTVGRACVAPPGIEPALVKADCFRFRLIPNEAESEFVSLQLTAGAEATAGFLATGSTRSRIPLSVTSSRKIALPPINEQKTILQYIWKLQDKIDTLITKARRAIDLLKERRTALISAAVTGKIDVREAA